MIELTYLGVILCSLPIAFAGFVLGYAVACAMSAAGSADDRNGMR